MADDLANVPLNDRTAPLQRSDWLGPLMHYVDTSYDGNRAERFHRILDGYRCPANNRVNDALFRSGVELPDLDDFDAFDTYPTISYVSSLWFHQ